MKIVSIAVALLLLGACATGTQRPAPAPQPAPVAEAPAAEAAAAPQRPQPAETFRIPVEYHKLDNGLKVVLSPDRTAPTAVVAVYYGIGFRVEPRGRTGFAHLFEHLMFQGSENLGKTELVRLVQANGGLANGMTRFDFTNYFEVVPSHALEPMLWAEADRMRTVAVTQENLRNQQDVVKNEVRVTVLNQPYGGFPWLDLPQQAYSNWYNSHNFYGDLADIDAATVDEAREFFRTYYAPNNAVLAVTGDFDSAQALGWIRQYFGPIAAQAQPARPDITEPRQTVEKRHVRIDDKATRPALAVAWHAPPAESDEYYALALIDQILAAGDDSWLHQALVRERGLTGGVESAMNLLGNMFNIHGPGLYSAWLFHDRERTAEEILAAIDDNIARLQTQLVDTATLERARLKMRSAYYRELETLFGFGRADLLASFALFHDDPARVNQIEARFASVTPELIQRTAQEYLRTTNRTVVMVRGNE